MSCPILTKWRESPLGTHSKTYFQLVNFTPELEASLTAKLHNTPAEAFESQLGEHIYYLVGSALAAKGNWNRMTFLQLEHEARVLGLLGTNETHAYTEWEFRLMLACEEKQHEVWVGDNQEPVVDQRSAVAC
ncbi:hypothetical protein IQ06DRAFT_369984 [Phaeosphaeriaceae sp. SRC1lsM3a]|nr:hypothetical protein IQ06DRAFT_369984 [Stagonospora sp. SRC1lsM3a]